MFRKGFVISTIITILAALPCIADTGYSARINELIAQKQAKMKQLEKCRGTTKNLKIAGLSTLGITVVGVGGNIAEAVILNQYDDKISDAEKAKENMNLPKKSHDEREQNSDTQGEQPEEQPEIEENAEQAQQASGEPSEFEKLCTKYGWTPEQSEKHIKCKLTFPQETDLKSAKMPLETQREALGCDSGKDMVCTGNICSLECKKSSKSNEYDTIEVEFNAINDNVENGKCEGVTNKKFCERCKGEGVELDVYDEDIACYKKVNKTITGPEAEKEFLEFKKQVYPESKDTRFFAAVEREIFKYYDKQPNDSKEFKIKIRYNAITCPIKGQVPDGWSDGGICICPKGTELKDDKTECVPK